VEKALTRGEVDVVVVGSGPGGATVARQLAQAQKRVILLERGRDHREQLYYGTHLGALIYGDKGCLLFTEEGLNIVRPLMTGGATNMFTGSAARPPQWLKQRYGIDIDVEVEDTIKELALDRLPDDALGERSTRIMEAANSLGYDWQPLMKFMRPSHTARFDCGAKCMLGCRCGAKWTANEYVDDAVAAGCELMTRSRVDDLIIEDARVVGVRGKMGRSTRFEIRAEAVVLAAGGIGTPIILQNAGFFEAGNGMAMDTTTIVYGTSKYGGISSEPPMSVAYTDDENGYMLSTLIDPWLLYPMINSLKGIRYPFTWFNYGNTMGMMIKIKDELSGGVSLEGRISKPLTPFVGPLRGTHPCATVRIGEMLDENLRTEVENLYVCDASCFPEALDRPTVLTIIGLGKRLGEHLLQEVLRSAAGGDPAVPPVDQDETSRGLPDSTS
jgi:choline dehydrogenase-like flavoprotein